MLGLLSIKSFALIAEKCLQFNWLFRIGSRQFLFVIKLYSQWLQFFGFYQHKSFHGFCLKDSDDNLNTLQGKDKIWGHNFWPTAQHFIRAVTIVFVFSSRALFLLCQKLFYVVFALLTLPSLCFHPEVDKIQI